MCSGNGFDESQIDRGSFFCFWEWLHWIKFAHVDVWEQSDSLPGCTDILLPKNLQYEILFGEGLDHGDELEIVTRLESEFEDESDIITMRYEARGFKQWRRKTDTWHSQLLSARRVNFDSLTSFRNISGDWEKLHQPCCAWVAVSISVRNSMHAKLGARDFVRLSRLQNLEELALTDVDASEGEFQQGRSEMTQILISAGSLATSLPNLLKLRLEFATSGWSGGWDALGSGDDDDRPSLLTRHDWNGEHGRNLCCGEFGRGSQSLTISVLLHNCTDESRFRKRVLGDNKRWRGSAALCRHADSGMLGHFELNNVAM